MLPDFAENKLKIIGVIFGILIIADLTAINLKVFSPNVEAPPVLPTVFPQEAICPTACFTAISAATSGAVKKISSPPTLPTVSQSTVKEIYVPLGNGSTNSLDWVEIPGAETVLDTANFSKIKSVIFEAFLSIPTGNGKAYAKLYNITDKHDIWFSEAWVEGGDTQRVESKDISFDAGRKVYRVMMKTTMGYEAVLESARLKIILE